MSTGYEGGFTRRQELTCTETEMAAYADVVLYENEHIYIKMNSGMIRLKIGDGKTGLLNLPWAKVFDATLDDVEAIVGGFASRVETNTKRIENLESAISPEIVTPVTDSTMAYAKTVPKGALPNAAITEIGGMSYVKNGVLVDSKVTAIESVGANLLDMSKLDNLTYNGVVFTKNHEGKYTLSGTTTENVTIYLSSVICDNSTKIWLSGGESGVLIAVNAMRNGYFVQNIGTVQGTTIQLVQGVNYDSIEIHLIIAKGKTFSNVTFYAMLNQGSTALPYSPYFRETLPIPADALDGFGQGVNAQLYNKIVLDPLEGVKKYRQVCAKRAYEDGDENLANAITDGTKETVYELATPVETNVSAYFTDDNLLPVEAGGTITAANEFEHEVPFTVEYMIKGA